MEPVTWPFSRDFGIISRNAEERVGFRAGKAYYYKGNAEERVGFRAGKAYYNKKRFASKR
jgi:hypothetical protein